MNLQVSKIEQIIAKEKTVVCVASELGVSRQTMHKRVMRYKRFGVDGLMVRRKTRATPAHNRTPAEVELLVCQLGRTYFQDGVETLRDRLLEENNIDLDASTVYRILKRNDVRYTDNYATTKKRWKKQLFAHEIPGKELQMDMKYPFGYKQGKVIYTIIDDASRWVFAWCYEKADAENTVDFLNKVLKRFPGTIRKVRTDQGTEFSALAVRNFLKTHRIKHRLNTPYCPEENGKIERFHGTLNRKAIRRGFKPNDTLDETQYKLNLFLHYYNYRKKHRGLGMNGLTPIQKLNELSRVNLTLQYHKVNLPLLEARKRACMS